MICGGAVNNPGIWTFGTPPEDAVLIVTGLPSSGTTALAWAISQCAPLHYDGIANLEHYAWSEAVERGDIGTAAELMRDRPARWATKRPLIYQHAATLRELLGPRLCWLVIVRDAVAVAGRCHLAEGGELLQWLRQVHCWQAELLEFLAARPEPFAIVSQQILRTSPESVISRALEWI